MGVDSSSLVDEDDFCLDGTVGEYVMDVNSYCFLMGSMSKTKTREVFPLPRSGLPGGDDDLSPPRCLTRRASRLGDTSMVTWDDISPPF